MKLCEETGAVQPNCNYLREKRHGSRFIREHNIVLELLKTMMLPQLSQFNNWPRQTESVPRYGYWHQSNAVEEMILLRFLSSFKTLDGYSRVLHCCT